MQILDYVEFVLYELLPLRQVDITLGAFNKLDFIYSIQYFYIYFAWFSAITFLFVILEKRCPARSTAQILQKVSAS